MAKSRIGQNPLDSLIPDPETSKPESRHTGEASGDSGAETESRNTGSTASRQSGKASEAEKVKATFYLDPAAEAELEAVWLRLRRLTGRKVSKSEIVETALRYLAGDVEEKGEKSRFAKALK